MEYSADLSSLCSELFRAANTGNLDSFKRLALNVAKGIGMGVKEAIGKLISEDGRGFLHFAVQGGSLNLCKYLLETLKLNVDSKDGHDLSSLCSELFRAANTGNLDSFKSDTKIMTLLLSRGARIDAASRSGTALECAAVNGHRDAVKLLLDHGANTDVVSSQRMYRPLTSAILAKSWECVELLIQAGADPNAVSYGNTPLVAAVRDGNVDVITRLLEAGADPNYKMNVRLFMKLHRDFVPLVASLGISSPPYLIPSIVDLGMTALEIAAVYRNYQSVGVLLPVTSRIPTYPDWSIAGLVRDVHSDANKMQMEVYEKKKFHHAKSKGTEAFQGEQYLMAAHWFEEALALFPEDSAVLSNMSACFARLGDGIRALDYATKCLRERPEWPKAYYRLGVALSIQKRYNDAADAFNKGLTLEPRNKELKDAYMKAVEARLNPIKGRQITLSNVDIKH